MRKFVIVAIIIMMLLATAASAYYFFRSGENEETSGIAEQSEPKLLVSDNVVSAILSFSGEKIWYFTKDGKLFRRSISGGDIPEEFALPAIINNAIAVQWQQRAGDFIVEQNVSGHTKYQYYNAQAGSFTEYPAEMRSVAILSDDQRIAYDWVATSTKHELKTSNLDTTNFQKIADLFWPDYKFVASPAKNEIVMFGLNQSEPSNLVLVDLESGSFTNIGGKAVYRGAKFSPDGTKLLYGTDEGLFLYNFLTPELKRLTLRADMDSVTWNKSISGIIYADEKGIKTWDLSTGQNNIIYKFDKTISPKDMFWHPSKDLLFFTDGETGQLYSLEIK